MIRSLKKLVNNLMPSGQFARGIVAISSGQVLSQLSTVIAAPLATRMYSPADFGVYGVYTTLLSMIGLISSLKYDMAVALPKEESTALSVVRLASTVNIGTTALLVIVTIGAGKPVLRLLNAEAIQPYLVIVWAAVFLNGCYAILNAWALRNKAFKSVARASVISSTGYSALQVGFGSVGLGVYGLLLADICSRISSVFELFRKAGPPWSSLFRSRPWGLGVVARRYVRFPALSLPQTILNSISLYIPVLWLSASYGPDVAGLYGLAQRVFMAPMSVLTGAIAQVFLSASAEMNRTDPAQIERFFLMTVRRLLKAVIVPTLLIALAGPWAFSAVFGHRWLAAGSYVRILAPVYILGFAVSPVSNVLNVIERQDAMLVFDLVRTGLVLGSLACARYLAVSANTFLMVYSMAMSVCYVYLFFTMLIAVKRRSKAIAGNTVA